MKKNVMMRVASALLVAVLMTTCAISGTFAKYTTTDATDTETARVAKWGVTVDAIGGTAFAKNYKDVAGDDGTQVKANTDVKVVAPGTKGTLGGVTITGKPEVVVDVKVDANLTLTGWVIDTDAVYCPIVFTVTTVIAGVTTTKTIKINDTLANLEKAIEDEVKALSADDVAANTDLARSISIDWAWAYEVDEATDVKDTKLGNLATAPQISFNCSVEVTQVD